MTVPLSARLSQTLVAYTLEFDNAFEHQMADAGFPGAALSRVVWSNFFGVLPDDGRGVRELRRTTGAPAPRLAHLLNCLERWRFVGIDAGRDPIVRPTSKAVRAKNVWQPLDAAIEHRWRGRFGGGLVDTLCRSLREIVATAEVALPAALPLPAADQRYGAFPPRTSAAAAGSVSLASLLSQALLLFALEFERQSPLPLSLCAGVLRVVDADGIRARDLPALTGCSPETTAIGWLLRRTGCVTLTSVPGRGRIVALTARGVANQDSYRRLAEQIEREWIDRVGRATVDTIRESLDGILEGEDADGPIVAKGLVPSPGTTRAGDATPALGWPDRPAEKRRARDMAAQTQRFLANPAATLPHYPLWDMNRGFGP